MSTWLPWASRYYTGVTYDNQKLVAHEMGHALGLSHSSSFYNDNWGWPYDSQWDVMSRGGTCSSPDSQYGCIGVHTIAQVISGNSGSIFGSNVCATKEPGEPNHAGNPGGASVWYRWTAPRSGIVTIDTMGSTFDTLLAVYIGSAVNNLTLIASDDDSGGNLTSRVTFTATSGTTYRIAVDGYNGVAGNIRLSWSLAIPTPALMRIERATGNAYTDGAWISGGADIAERIDVSEPVEPGDVVELDPHIPQHYRKARSPYNPLVAGVIATAPGIIIGNQRWADSNDHDERPLLALIGRVGVKVTAENGPIRLGDLLTSSSQPGYAMRCSDLKQCEGAIIGKALEPLAEGAGVIMMLVMR